MKRSLIVIFACVQALFLSACTSASFFVANFPQYFNEAKITANVAYGDKPIQNLDIYRPSIKGTDKRPVIVFFHGGRWTDGNKEQYKFVALNLADQGYVVVIPDYSKYPNVKFPTFVEDSAKAVSWTYKNIENYGGDPENVFLLGHSSGAHMAGLIAADPKYLAKYDLSRDIINAFVGLSGPYAFEPDEPDLIDMFGPPERYPLMRVPTYVDGQQPPMFLLHGAEDDLVVFKNAQKVEEAVKKYGGSIKLKLYPDMGHIDLVSAFAWVKKNDTSVPDDTTNFFDAFKSP